MIDHAAVAAAWLRISETMAWPLDAALGRFILLGKSGSGKSNAIAVLAEEFVRAGIPTWIIDPLGNLFGLRSSPDGEGAGLPIVIFGGPHADLPLVDGAQMARTVANEQISAIFDLSALTWDEQRAWAEAFCDEALRVIHELKIIAHVILDEADRFAPNAIGRNAVKSFARTARNESIGYTFGTQRPQILAPEVIESASVIIAMKINGELAQDSIGKKTVGLVGKVRTREIVETLPKMQKGEAWLLPDSDWLAHAGAEDDAEPTRFRFRWRETFDSTAPRRVGVAQREMKVLASVDLTRLREALAVPDLAEETDPEALLARVAELEERIAEFETADMPESLAAMERRAVAAEDDMIAAQRQRDELASVVESLASVLRLIQTTAAAALEGLALDAARISDEPAPERSAFAAPADATGPQTILTSVRPPTPRARVVTEPGAMIPVGNLSGGRQRMLDVLAGNRDGRLTRAELGMLSGYAHGGGTFQKYASDLKGQGFIEVLGGQIVLTDTGRALATPVKRTSREVTGHWLGVVKGGRRAMLEQLVKIYPAAISRAELGERAGYAADGGTYQKYLSDLKGADLVTVTSAGVRAADELFPTGAIR